MSASTRIDRKEGRKKEKKHILTQNRTNNISTLNENTVINLSKAPTVQLPLWFYYVVSSLVHICYNIHPPTLNAFRACVFIICFFVLSSGYFIHSLHRTTHSSSSVLLRCTASTRRKKALPNGVTNQQINI